MSYSKSEICPLTPWLIHATVEAGIHGGKLFPVQLTKYGGKNRAQCPWPTPLLPLTLQPKPFSAHSPLVAFTDGSLYKLFMGWDGYLSPEAKRLKQFSLSSQRLLCKQEVCEIDLTGTLSLRGWRG